MVGRTSCEGVKKKPYRYTIHAGRHLIDYDLTDDVIRSVYQEGKITKEGRNKYRISKRTKRGVIYLLVGETSDHTTIITIGIGK